MINKTKKSVGIMQPHFFPRAAYFKLILKSNTFVILDNIPFERQSWQSRNRILTKNGILYINIPIIKSNLGTEIKDINVKPLDNWFPRLERTLTQNYAKSFYKKDFELLINEVFTNNFLDRKSVISLVNINLKIINIICKFLDINFYPVFSSELKTKGSRSDRLIDILDKLNATVYHAVEGSRAYLEKDGFSEKMDIDVSFINLNLKPYNHTHSKDFIPNLSILDMISSLGFKKTRECLES